MGAGAKKSPTRCLSSSKRTNRVYSRTLKKCWSIVNITAFKGGIKYNIFGCLEQHAENNRCYNSRDASDEKVETLWLVHQSFIRRLDGREVKASEVCKEDLTVGAMLLEEGNLLGQSVIVSQDTCHIKYNYTALAIRHEESTKCFFHLLRSAVD